MLPSSLATCLAERPWAENWPRQIRESWDPRLFDEKVLAEGEKLGIHPDQWHNLIAALNCTGSVTQVQFRQALEGLDAWGHALASDCNWPPSTKVWQQNVIRNLMAFEDYPPAMPPADFVKALPLLASGYTKALSEAVEESIKRKVDKKFEVSPLERWLSKLLAPVPVLRRAPLQTRPERHAKEWVHKVHLNNANFVEVREATQQWLRKAFDEMDEISAQGWQADIANLSLSLQTLSATQHCSPGQCFLSIADILSQKEENREFALDVLKAVPPSRNRPRPYRGGAVFLPVGSWEKLGEAALSWVRTALNTEALSDKDNHALYHNLVGQAEKSTQKDEKDTVNRLWKAWGGEVPDVALDEAEDVVSKPLPF